MSTKTSIKRIAAVAALALTLGGFSAVSAFAGPLTAVVVKSANTNTYTDGTTPIAAGTALTFDLKITTTGDLANGDNGTSTYTVNAGPAPKDITSTCTFAAATVTNLTIAVTTAATGKFTYTATGAVAAGTITLGTASCPSTIGGLYTVASAGTAALADATVITPTVTAPGVAKSTGAVYVSGGNVSQGITRSTTTGTASVGGSATAIFTLPTHLAGDIFYVLPAAGGVGTITSAAATVGALTRYNGSTSDYSAGVIDTTADTALDTVTVIANSAVAGVQTLNLVAINSSTGVATTKSTVTITWGSVAAVSAPYTAGGSYIADGNVVPTSALQTASTLTYAKTAALTPVATIGVALKDASNVAMVGTAVTAAITSGPGLLSFASGATAAGSVANCSARSITLTSTTQAAASASTVGVCADGAAGTTVITVSAGSTVLFTKTVIFYGTVSKISLVAQNLFVARAGSAGYTLGSAVAGPAGTSVATLPAFTVSALDSNGSVVPGLTITIKSTDSAVIASGTVIQSDGTGLGDGYAGPGYYNVSVSSAAGGVSGATTTVVARTLLSDGVTYVTSDPITFTLGGSASTGKVSIALDAATYTAGAAAKLTVTAKDSAGNPIYDQDLNLWGGLGTAPFASKSVVGLAPAAAATKFIKGVKTYTGYAPALSGAWNISGTVDSITVLSGAAVSTSATVSGDDASNAANSATDAANEATDAANAATDAALAAADAADAATAAAQNASDAVAELSATVAKLVASLKAQITSLTNLVIKIQKKVKA